MDPLNLEVIETTIKTVNSTTIPLLEEAVRRQLAQATTDISGVVDRSMTEAANNIQGLILGLQAITDKASMDLDAIVSRLDGATVTVHLSPQQK
jgi:hypothetical protein